MKPNRRQKLTPQNKVKIVTDYSAKMPIKDMVAKHGVSKVTIYKVLKETIN